MPCKFFTLPVFLFLFNETNLISNFSYIIWAFVLSLFVYPCMLQAGRYNTVAGTPCKICDGGKYNTQGGLSSCTNCPRGWFREVAAQNWKKQCLIDYCNAHAACKTAECGGSTCVQGTDQIQTYWNGLSAADKETHHSINPAICIGSVCDSCNIGQSQPDPGKMNCINCKSGRYQNERIKFDCKDCLEGQSQTATGREDCDACVTGKYSDVAALDICKSCPIGYIGTGAGGATSDSTCSICDAGRFAGPTAAQIQCQICPKGFYLPVGTLNIVVFEI